MAYKVGGKVWLRDDLEDGKYYGVSTIWCKSMRIGRIVTINNIHHADLECEEPHYHIYEDGFHVYTEEMIDHDKTARLHRDQQEDPQPEIVESPGGGKKDDGGKLRMDLLDPEFLEEVAKVLSYGSRKYGDYNFLGLEPHRVEASLFRHFNDYRKGEHIDHDEPHCNNMAGVAANAMMWFMIERENKNEAVL